MVYSPYYNTYAIRTMEGTNLLCEAKEKSS